MLWLDRRRTSSKRLVYKWAGRRYERVFFSRCATLPRFRSPNLQAWLPFFFTPHDLFRKSCSPRLSFLPFFWLLLPTVWFSSVSESYLDGRTDGFVDTDGGVFGM